MSKGNYQSVKEGGKKRRKKSFETATRQLPTSTRTHAHKHTYTHTHTHTHTHARARPQFYRFDVVLLPALGVQGVLHDVPLRSGGQLHVDLRGGPLPPHAHLDGCLLGANGPQVLHRLWMGYTFILTLPVSSATPPPPCSLLSLPHLYSPP